jgi:phosphate transport system substrate-binding protein
MERYSKLVLNATCAIIFSGATEAGEATGAGSTFAYPVLSRWAAEYAAASGNQIKYQSVGSGAGMSQIRIGAVDFSVSDVPLSSDSLNTLGFGQFPLVVGGIAPVINLSGVRPGELRFSGPLLADIYLGKVNNWNDPAIRRLNPDLNLPDMSITRVYRSDVSGTTFNWMNYLSTVSSAWRQTLGERFVLARWPASIAPNGIGGRGNDEVAGIVRAKQGAIGYVEYAYALQHGMTYGLVRNQAGLFVKPDAQNCQEAISSVSWSSEKDFYLLVTNAAGEQSYPITATVFILIPKKAKDPGRTKVALELFAWGATKGRKQAEALQYVPVPEEVFRMIERYWKAQFPM